MIPKFRAWVKPDILTNHLNGVIAEALPNFIYDHCLVLREDLVEDKQFEEILDFLDIELMQSTGMKDKNGVESWEGNYLVKDGYWPFFIKWIESEGCLMAVPVNSVQRTNWKPVSVKEKLDFGYVNEGNIYENPELLEDSDE